MGLNEVWELFSCLYRAKDKEEINKLFSLINSLKDIEDKRLYDFIKSEEDNYYKILNRMKRGLI